MIPDTGVVRNRSHHRAEKRRGDDGAGGKETHLSPVKKRVGARGGVDEVKVEDHKEKRGLRGEKIAQSLKKGHSRMEGKCLSEKRPSSRRGEPKGMPEA